MMIVEKIEQITRLFRVSYKTVFQVIGICFSTYRRWKKRIANAREPVQQAGPKPVKPLDFGKLHTEMDKLEHKAKRSHGVSELRTAVDGSISRRDLDLLIVTARKEAMKKKKAAQSELEWHEPGSVWAMDVFEIKQSYSPVKKYVLTVQDLATCYKFPPLPLEHEPRGHEVAAHIKKLSAQFGKPLFLKLDNGGNLNHHSIKELLAEQGVMPLNSPAYYAPYNGAIEHTQGEFKMRLQECYNKANSFAEFTLMVDLAAHDLNHTGRRKYKGKNSCLKFFGKTKINFTKRKRKEVFEWISDLAIDIVVKSGEKKIRSTAWRVACRRWLEKNGLVSIRKMQAVLPTF